MPRFPRAHRLSQICLVLALLAPTIAYAADYDVGDGQPYAAIADVPWAELQPGDAVFIHGRATPFAERWGITASGTEAAPIRVVGVPGPGGEPAVIDGDGASEGPDAHPRGLVTIRGGAQYVVLQDLELRNASPEFGHPDNASGVYAEEGAHLDFVGLTIHGCGNGFFSVYSTSDVRLADSTIFGNGNADSLYEHNIYTESDGIVFEGNRLGLLREGALGNNLKDRSAHTVVRFNWIEGGNRALDLVEPQDGYDSFGEAATNEATVVYGNVLVKRDDGTPNDQVVHFGGEGSGVERRLLYFFHNTMVSTRPSTTAFSFDAAMPTAWVVNNLFVTTGGGSLRMLDSNTPETLQGALDHAFVVTGWEIGLGRYAEWARTDLLEGDDPGFVSLRGEDLHLAAGAIAIDAAGPLPAEVAAFAVDREWAQGPTTIPRVDDGAPDLGAFEHCEGDACGSGGDTSGGSADGGTDDGGTADGGTNDGGTNDGGTPGDAGSAEGGSQADASASGGSSGTGSGAADDAGAGGCGCGLRDRGATPWLLVGLVATARRRRRP